MSYIILFGGNSFEHEISVVSAITLKKELDISHFVFVESSSNMFLIPSEKMTSKLFSTLAYKDEPKIIFTNGGFIKKTLFSNQKIQGIVINLIHGKSGEDGQIASLLDFYNIPFIGPRVESSVVSFNKELSKIYAASRGVNVLDYAVIRKDEDRGEIAKKIRFIAESSVKNRDSKDFGDSQDLQSVIIKPARLGSSIGISVIKDIDNTSEIDYALDVGFELDDTLIIEPFIANIKEYNLAGCAIEGDFRFSIIESVSKNEFLDFDKKYLDFSGNRAIKEAVLEDSLKTALKDSFKKIYQNCFEGALIRCDFFIFNDKVYLNEINPIPGSMAYYLFHNLREVLDLLSASLPQKKTINIQYKYISSIQSAKGK